MSQLPSLKQIQRYQRDRKARDRDGIFYIEGTRNFLQADERGLKFKALVIAKKLLVVPFVQKRVRELKREGVPSLTISPEDFRKMGLLERASGIAALVEQPQSSLQSIQPDAGLYWTAVDHIRSAGNLGTLIRSAEGSGCAGFLLLSHKTDPYDPAVIRASVGAQFHQRFVRCSPEELKDWVSQHGARVLGADPEGEQSYYELQAHAGPTILMLGEERKGLSPQQRQLCTQMLRIPMRGQADSLNVSVAGTLLMYEILRAQENLDGRRT